jgi:hypothetical protein
LIDENPPLHLHARKLKFYHPFKKDEVVEIVSPLPKHFTRTLEELGMDIEEIKGGTILNSPE